jgi:hypothetical protein
MKTLGAFVFLFVAASNGFGQGSSLNFCNEPAVFSDGVDRYVYSDVVGGNRLVGANWMAELYFGPNASSLTPVTSSLSIFRSSSSAPALWGTWVCKDVSLLGSLPGSMVALQVRVWDQSLFSTFEQAQAGGGAYGMSAPFSFVIPSGPLDDNHLTGLRAFSLVPEPSVIAFGVLGICALLFRLNKHRVQPITWRAHLHCRSDPNGRSNRL